MIKARRGTLRVPEYEPFFADHLPRVPDLLQRLSWEHRQIEKLWKDLQRLHAHDGVTPQPRMGADSEAGVAQMLVQALADHEAAERGVLHPAAVKVMTPEWAEANLSEYDELEAMLEQVDGADPTDDEVFAVYEQVFSRVMAHINEEEKIVFPVMRVASPPADLVNPEGYDFLGLPPGKTMIAVTPGQRPLALGTGRARAQRQMALGAGAAARPTGDSPTAEPAADGNGHAEVATNGNGHAADKSDGNGKGKADSDESGEVDIDLTAIEAEARTNKTRAKRLLRRR